MQGLLSTLDRQKDM